MKLALNMIRLPLQWTGRNTPNYMHPSVALLPDDRWLMTLQEQLDDDYYGAVHYCISDDYGESWSAPEAIEAFRTNKLSPRVAEGVADVRCFNLDAATILAIGCNAYYTAQGCATWDRTTVLDVPTPEYPVYALYRNGAWGPRRELRIAPPGATADYWRIACAQIARGMREHEWILPLYTGQGHYAAQTIAVRWTGGDRLEMIAAGNVLRNAVGRGMIEPSVIKFGSRYFMTLRAEDECGYWTVSGDGLQWDKPRCWCYIDGERLTMSSTQQHFLFLDGQLYLLYTRKTPDNGHVMRFRAPLFIAQFEPDNGGLNRASEQIVLPRRNEDGMAHVLGNFHVMNRVDGSEGLVCDSDCFLRTQDGVMIDSFSEVALVKILGERSVM